MEKDSSICPARIETFVKDEESMTFDDLLQKLNSFGPYQIKVFVLTTLFDFPGCWVAMFFLFGGYNPGYYCLSNEAKLANDNGTFNVNDYVNRTDFITEDVCIVNGSKCSRLLFKDTYHSALTEVSAI